MTIVVEGLKEVRASLKKLEDLDSQREIRAALKHAVEIIAVDARRRVPSKSGTAAKSIRSGTTGNRAYVAGGKATVPYYGWLDFGTRTPKKGNPRKVGPWAKSGKGPDRGRFLYPAIDAKQAETIADLDAGVQQVIRRVWG